MNINKLLKYPTSLYFSLLAGVKFITNLISHLMQYTLNILIVVSYGYAVLGLVFIFKLVFFSVSPSTFGVGHTILSIICLVAHIGIAAISPLRDQYE